MAGTLLCSGQEWVLNRMLDYINSSGVYIGLMEENSKVPEASQIGDGITETTASGYVRSYSSGWSLTVGNDPYISGPSVTFTASGTWQSVNGYFVSSTSGTATALWTVIFPSGMIGDKADGDQIIITPKYEQADYSE